MHLDSRMHGFGGTLYVFSAETRAILTRLWCCMREGYRRIEVESDALNVIKAIEIDNWELSPIRTYFL